LQSVLSVFYKNSILSISTGQLCRNIVDQERADYEEMATKDRIRYSLVVGLIKITEQVIN
jgi:hypothetical protein